jgi:hypothetical protein
MKKSLHCLYEESKRIENLVTNGLGYYRFSPTQHSNTYRANYDLTEEDLQIHLAYMNLKVSEDVEERMKLRNEIAIRSRSFGSKNPMRKGLESDSLIDGLSIEAKQGLDELFSPVNLAKVVAA